MGSLVLRDSNMTLNESDKNDRLDQFVSDVFEQEKHLASVSTGISNEQERNT